MSSFLVNPHHPIMLKFASLSYETVHAKMKKCVQITPTLLLMFKGRKDTHKIMRVINRFNREPLQGRIKDTRLNVFNSILN